MPELGDKHTCADCETKYYDLGRTDATCPKCGSANRVVEDEVAAAPPRAPRTKSRPKPDKAADDAKKKGDGEDGADDDKKDEDDAAVAPGDEDDGEGDGDGDGDEEE